MSNEKPEIRAWPEAMMGLPKPEREPQDIDEMRREIERGRRNSGLIQNCLVSARYQGMNGEDTYTQLAYHALRAVETLYAQNLEFLRCYPPKIWVVPPQTDPTEPGIESP